MEALVEDGSRYEVGVGDTRSNVFQSLTNDAGGYPAQEEA